MWWYISLREADLLFSQLRSFQNERKMHPLSNNMCSRPGIISKENSTLCKSSIYCSVPYEYSRLESTVSYDIYRYCCRHRRMMSRLSSCYVFWWCHFPTRQGPHTGRWTDFKQIQGRRTSTRTNFYLTL